MPTMKPELPPGSTKILEPNENETFENFQQRFFNDAGMRRIFPRAFERSAVCRDQWEKAHNLPSWRRPPIKGRALK